MAMLNVTGISKKENGIFTVDDITFAQNPFQKIAIAGETGSGKSTLLKMIAGLVQPDAGEIKFENERVAGPFEKLLPGHARIAYLSQHFELRNNYRVEEELESANKLTVEEASRIFNVCRVDHLLKRKTNQLSGGERQRIVLARTLISKPGLLLLDEPFSNLDLVHKKTMMAVIRELGNNLRISCIMVLHDAADTLSWADEILVMKDGVIIQRGTPEQIYNQPVNEYCAGLFGDYNLISSNNSSILSAIPGIVINGKQLLVRPEHFYIVEEGNISIRGTVQTRLYFGSYYVLDVLVAQQLIRIKANKNEFAVGDPIVLSLSPKDIWLI
ncbi:MAG: ABC transporter ATP-binding protein [Chitinophagaceae bacterium]